MKCFTCDVSHLKCNLWDEILTAKMNVGCAVVALNIELTELFRKKICRLFSILLMLIYYDVTDILVPPYTYLVIY